MTPDYRKYYFLEGYLEEVRNNFKRGYLTPEEFFCIVIWKANRAKTKIKKRLLLKNNLKDAVKELTRDIFKEKGIDKLTILLNKWGFMLPMATAILTVLYPEEFSVYDIRVREQLGSENVYSANKYFSEFLPKVKQTAKDKNLSLRDADRYLWGKSFYESLEVFLK
ncbi:MAG: hypothetical protein NT155_00700 [Candidatus Staskawiczbacteria bacterium]|nr:hypothetical protein [Candidatus Staskawiczbacteria bacterium]